MIKNAAVQCVYVFQWMLKVWSHWGIFCICMGKLSQKERHLLHGCASSCFAPCVLTWLIWPS